MPSSTDIILLASAARVASGTGASVDLGLKTGLALDLAVSAAGGASPTLDVTLETSKDGAAWRTLGAFPRVTAAGPMSKVFAGADRYLRAVWELGGVGPSFTFGLAGRALLLYATPADVAVYGVVSTRLKNLDPEHLAKHLVAATDQANEQIGNRFTLPLVSWPDSLRKYISEITAWAALSSAVGVNPQTGDQDIRQRHDAALRMLVSLGAEEGVAAPGYIDSTPDEYDGGGGFVESDPPRGW